MRLTGIHVDIMLKVHLLGTSITADKLMTDEDDKIVRELVKCGYVRYVHNSKGSWLFVVNPSFIISFYESFRNFVSDVPTEL